MTIFKRTSAVLMAIALIFSVTACARGNDDPYSSSESSSSVITPVVKPDDDQSIEEKEKPSQNTSPQDPQPLPKVDLAEFSELDNTSVPWGPGTAKNDDGKPTACVDLQKKYDGTNGNFILPNTKNVVLTFDQGYENGFTASILDTLKEKEIQGVFFITGHYLKTQPELIQRMIDEGHILGSHSYNHLDFTNNDPQKLYDDLEKLHNDMLDQFNYELELFRYPEGKFSQRSLAIVNALGYRTLFWSFAYKDWDPANQMSQSDALNKIKSNVHEGEIMLLHTVGETNSLILGDLIDYLKNEGFTVGPDENFLGR